MLQIAHLHFIHMTHTSYIVTIDFPDSNYKQTTINISQYKIFAGTLLSTHAAYIKTLNTNYDRTLSKKKLEYDKHVYSFFTILT